MWTTGEQITTADFQTTNTTATNIAPASGPTLTIALAASKVYEVEAVLVLNSSSNAGVKAALAYSAAGATGNVVYQGMTSATAVGTIAAALGALEGTVYVGATSVEGLLVAKAIVVTGANAGNLTMQLAKVTSGTATARKGSILRARLVG